MEKHKIEDYAEDFFTLEEMVDITNLREHLKRCADEEDFYEIGGNSANLLYKYITQLEQGIINRMW